MMWETLLLLIAVGLGVVLHLIRTERKLNELDIYLTPLARRAHQRRKALQARNWRM